MGGGSLKKSLCVIVHTGSVDCVPSSTILMIDIIKNRT